MLLPAIEIYDDSLVTDIVARDYRSSAVFRKYNIEFCCGGRIPLHVACKMHGLDIEVIKKQLKDCIRNIYVSNALDFNNWDIDFLIDYIRNIHHAYLAKKLPEITHMLEVFYEGHQKKYTWLAELLASFRNLKKLLLPHLEYEEQVIFPYIKQISHAYHSQEPYAALLVRALRKPVEVVMNQEHEDTGNYLRIARKLTTNYTPPPDACLTHKVCFSNLEELDNDLVQHTHMENNILFPKAIAMEKELLQSE